MVLDFQHYHSGLPGLPFIAGIAAKHSLSHVLNVVVCNTFLGRFDHVILPASCTSTLVILFYWNYAVLSRRPPGRKRLLSLPGGHAFAAMSSRLGRELRTVWLGEGANCHETVVTHPYSTAACPWPRDKDCWQCLYILQVEMTLAAGEVPVAATTNLYSGCCCSGPHTWERTYGPGSSEVPSEQADLKAELPPGWGEGTFDAVFGRLDGCCRAAQLHPDTGQPLGLGCRWERRYLDSLEQTIFVVAQPPSVWGLAGGFLVVTVMNTLSVLMVLVLPTAYFTSMAWEEMNQTSPMVGYVLLAAFCLPVMAVLPCTLVLGCKELVSRAFGQMRPLTESPRYLTRGGGGLDSEDRPLLEGP